MQISLTKLRGDMFNYFHNLKDGEELTVTFEGRPAYIIKKAVSDRNTRFKQALSKCPKLFLTDEEIISFKNEGRR